jgi:hypothetical protein
MLLSTRAEERSTLRDAPSPSPALGGVQVPTRELVEAGLRQLFGSRELSTLHELSMPNAPLCHRVSCTVTGFGTEADRSQARRVHAQRASLSPGVVYRDRFRD